MFYRLIPMRVLRRTKGVKFDEMVPSDIPKIDGIDRVIHGSNSISPGPINNIKRPWYMHPGQDDNLMVLQGERYIDIYEPISKKSASFIVSPERIYKNDKLYYDGPAMIVWPAGVYHRIISGDTGSISLNFATRNENFKLEDNFNIYDLDRETGNTKLLRKGSEDQPDFYYKYPSQEIKKMVKEIDTIDMKDINKNLSDTLSNH
jgi:hypothetical protein